jgi:toxin ParE1/3/4
MGQVVFSAPAQADLQDLWDYLGARNPEAANRLMDELKAKFLLLAQSPQMGKACDPLLVNLRRFPYKNYVIFYFPNADGIEIYRVVHGSRDIETLFDDFINSLEYEN